MTDGRYLMIPVDEYKELVEENEAYKKMIQDMITLEEKQAMQWIINNLKIHNARLEKALDKACERLNVDTLLFKSLNFTKGIKRDNYSKEEWKEWCLKDVE